MQTETDVRDRALGRLKKKSDFKAHVIVYVLVNALLVTIWAMTGAHFFWPIFPIVGWGIGVLMNAWDVYRKAPSEEQIRREIERIR